jgi:hypothetical protein
MYFSGHDKTSWCFEILMVISILVYFSIKIIKLLDIYTIMICLSISTVLLSNDNNNNEEEENGNKNEQANE